MAKVPEPKITIAGISQLHKWGYRSAGLSGGLIPVVGDLISAAGTKALKGRGLVQQAKWLGQGATASIGLGATLAADQYHQRWGLGNLGARGLENISFGMYKAPASAWESSPKTSWESRGVQFSTRTERISRKRDGPPSLSQRTRRSPSFGKRRPRCQVRNKRGKRCLRPRGHSGRHRYQ